MKAKMRFKGRLKRLVLSGRKTQTRRLSGVYRVGARYRLNHEYDILILSKRREKLGDISPSDVRAEGFRSLEEFVKAWKSIYGWWDPNRFVWVYEFRLVPKGKG